MVAQTSLCVGVILMRLGCCVIVVCTHSILSDVPLGTKDGEDMMMLCADVQQQSHTYQGCCLIARSRVLTDVQRSR